MEKGQNVISVTGEGSHAQFNISTLPPLNFWQVPTDYFNTSDLIIQIILARIFARETRSAHLDPLTCFLVISHSSLVVSTATAIAKHSSITPQYLTIQSNKDPLQFIGILVVY